MVNAHPIHVTITDMKHNEEQGRIEVIFRGFIDDFDDAVENMHDTILGIDQDTFSRVLADSLICNYLKQKIIISINNQLSSIDYIGFEREDEFVWCYLEIKNVESINLFDIENLVLLEHFSDQTNMIHLDANGRISSTFFNKSRRKDSFKY